MGLTRATGVLRGVVSTALTWMTVWVPISLIPIGLAVTFTDLSMPGRVWAMIVVSRAVEGAISGALFAGVLAIAGRRKRFAELRLGWVAVCGAAGGAALPLLLKGVFLAGLGLPVAAVAWGVATGAALGAGLAAGSLALARRAPEAPSLPATGSQLLGPRAT